MVNRKHGSMLRSDYGSDADNGQYYTKTKPILSQGEVTKIGLILIDFFFCEFVVGMFYYFSTHTIMPFHTE